MRWLLALAGAASLRAIVTVGAPTTGVAVEPPNIVNGAEYQFNVRAVNESGLAGLASDVALVRALNLPSAPTSLEVIRNLALYGGFHFFWDAPASSGGGDIIRYELEMADPGGDYEVQSFNSGGNYPPPGPTETWFAVETDYNRNPNFRLNYHNRLYSVRVRAVNSEGKGPASAPIDARVYGPNATNHFPFREFTITPLGQNRFRARAKFPSVGNILAHGHQNGVREQGLGRVRLRAYRANEIRNVGWPSIFGVTDTRLTQVIITPDHTSRYVVMTITARNDQFNDFTQFALDMQLERVDSLSPRHFDEDINAHNGTVLAASYPHTVYHSAPSPSLSGRMALASPTVSGRATVRWNSDRNIMPRPDHVVGNNFRGEFRLRYRIVGDGETVPPLPAQPAPHSGGIAGTWTSPEGDTYGEIRNINLAVDNWAFEGITEGQTLLVRLRSHLYETYLDGERLPGRTPWDLVGTEITLYQHSRPLLKPKMELLSHDDERGVAEVRAYDSGNLSLGWYRFNVYHGASPQLPEGPRTEDARSSIDITLNAPRGANAAATLTLNRLKPDTNYAFFGQAHTYLGKQKEAGADNYVTLRSSPRGKLEPLGFVGSLVPPPSRELDLEAEGGGGVSFAWQAPAENEDGEILYYELLARNASLGLFVTASINATATSYIFLPPIETPPQSEAARYAQYDFVLRAQNGVLPGLPTTVAATPEGPPQSHPTPRLVAHDIYNGVVVVSVADMGVYPIDFVRLQAYTAAVAGLPPTGENGVLYKQMTVTVSTAVGQTPTAAFTLTGLAQGKSYALYPQTWNQYGKAGVASVVVSMTLRNKLAPVSLRAALVADGDISLSWQAPPPNEDGEILDYLVSWGSEESAHSGSAVLSASASAYVAEFPLASDRYIAYIFSVQAKNSVGLGVAATATATPEGPPRANPVPTLVAKDDNFGRVEISLSGVGDYPADYFRLAVYTATSPVAEPSDAGALSQDLTLNISTSYGQTATVVFSVTGLLQGQRYAFYPQVWNKYGSGGSRHIVVSMELRRKLAPVSLRGATVAETGRISLSWQAPPDNNDGALLDYLLHWSGPVGERGSMTLAAAATAHIVTGIADSSPRYAEYTFDLRARNAYGLGATARIQATPQGVAQLPPQIIVARQDNARGVVSLSLSNAGAYPIENFVVEAYTAAVADLPLAGDNRALERVVSLSVDAGLGVNPAGQIVISSLMPGVAYAFYGFAQNQYGSVGGNFAQASMALRGKLAPVSLRVEAIAGGDEDLRASWQAPPQNLDGDLLGYSLVWSGAGDSNTLSLSATAQVMTISAVAAFAPYTVTLWALNSVGLGLPAAAVGARFAAPHTPPSLAVSVDQGRGVAVANIVGLGLYPVSRYRFVVSYADAGASPFAPEATAVTTHNAQVDAGFGETPEVAVTVSALAPGKVYGFLARSFNQHGASGDSSVVVSVGLRGPLPPANLQAESQDGAIRLTWERPPENGDIVVPEGLRYSVYWSDADGNANEAAAGDNLFYEAGGLQNFVDYTFSVLAFNGSLAGGVATVTDNPGFLPGAPALAARAHLVDGVADQAAGVFAASLSVGALVERWEFRVSATVFYGTQDAESRIAGAAAVAGGGRGEAGAYTLTRAGNQAVNNLLLPLQSVYVFKAEARAVTRYGTTPYGEVLITTYAPPATAPANFVATPFARGASLQWSAWNPPEGQLEGFNRAGYVVTYEGIRINRDTGDAFAVNNLLAGREYVFTLQALNAYGPGAKALATATPPSEAPQAPASVYAMAANEALVLRWQYPPSDGGASITGYVVGYGAGESVSFAAQSLTTAVVNGNAFYLATIGGLTNGETVSVSVLGG